MINVFWDIAPSRAMIVAVMMVAADTSETSANLCQNTWLGISQDGHLLFAYFRHISFIFRQASDSLANNFSSAESRWVTPEESTC
jgi:hypothetical protein